MKKVLYSALAVTAAIAGVAATKANNKPNRAVFLYRYIAATSSTASQVTNVANWTLTNTKPGCPFSTNACSVTTTIPPTAANKPSAKIPAIQTGTSTFTAQVGSLTPGAPAGTNVIARFSKL